MPKKSPRESILGKSLHLKLSFFEEGQKGKLDEAISIVERNMHNDRFNNSVAIAKTVIEIEQLKTPIK